MPYSMTGFGAAEGPVAGGRLRVEIRTVNHRYFNLAAKLPAELAALEGELRERLRRDFDRGHVAVQARWAEYPERAGGLTVDLERARLVDGAAARAAVGAGARRARSRWSWSRGSRTCSRRPSDGAAEIALGRGRADRRAGGGGVPGDARP